MCQTKGTGITAKHVNERCRYYILSLSEIACVSVFPFVTGFDYNPLHFFSKKAQNIIYDSDALFRSGMIFFIFQQCESSCESYEKKKPKEFLKSFAKLIKKVIRVDSSWLLFNILQRITDILVLHYF